MSDKPMLFSGPMVRALLAGTKTQTRRLCVLPEASGEIIDMVKVATDATTGRAIYEMKDRDGKHLTIRAGKHCVTPQYSPPHAVNDRLWVKETHRIHSWDEDGFVWLNYPADEARSEALSADNEEFLERLCSKIEKAGVKTGTDDRYENIPTTLLSRPSIHMPRWASRLTLTVTDVRVERLHDISRDDAMAEGIVQTWGDFMGAPPEWAVASINRHGDASGSHIYDNRTSAENYRELWNHINGAGSWDANPWVVAYSFTVQRGNIDHLGAVA